MLVPPANFGIAEEGIYRCSKVETLNLSFLETLDLKTVVYIGGQEPSKFFREFFNRSSIQWISIRTADYANVGTQVNSLKNSEITSDQEDSKQDDLDGKISDHEDEEHCNNSNNNPHDHDHDTHDNTTENKFKLEKIYLV
ncbi:Protein required for replication of Brome mosaic virus [Maudiozyma exigua]|uniref:Protein required for replication of Brome mosaic virus n=1 Tax=Maudiozyma exigua TaxID=34358 RepID=A0A9P6WC57_MAUEX|nr:Protein required for replication of Brome mosaic virus [Kazachstania exigua]